jgi:ABC-type polysaccharide/polyol phosphate export permease
MASVDTVTPELVLGDAPDSRRDWFADLWRHREVLGILTRKDFQTRYKRASLGIVWAVAVPSMQAAILAVVFSRVVRVGGSGAHYAVFVFGGVVCFSYFSAALGPAATAIVDASSLTDKVWFPRGILVVVPCISGLVGFAVTLVAMIVIMPLFDVGYGVRLLLLVPATVLLVLFTTSLSLCVAALYVYFRDVKYLVQAGLMVWIYVTPVLYPQHLLGRIAWLMDVNPLTGIVNLFHAATVGGTQIVGPALIVSVAATVALTAIAAETQRHYDRLFVDLL